MYYTIEPIAYIHNEFKSKFGIPRQSCEESKMISEIIFDEKYKDDNSLRGLEDYSHIWLLWIFSESDSNKKWSPSVRPPRLGGNKRMGVFATRSPYHPNRIGLSCVKIESIEKKDNCGTVIKVIGADLLDGTPIIDIKPYLTFTDSHPDAICGFADVTKNYSLDVVFENEFSDIPGETLENIKVILKQDPRPSYQNDKERVYGFEYSDYEIKFTVDQNILTVTSISKHERK